MTRTPTAQRPAHAPQRTGRHATPVSPPSSPDGRSPAAPRHLPEPRLVRRVVGAVLVGALTMFGVATLDAFAGATVPVLGTLAALPVPAAERVKAEEVAAAPPSNPGTCLSWARTDAADTTVVDCTQPHLFEQAGSVALTDQTTVPDDQQWRQLVNERCAPVVEQYLDGRFDPSGRYRIGALKPSAAKWSDGDRELRCGLQSASRSGALYPLTGKAAGSDQSGVQRAGTCLAIDGRTVGDPVACTGPHAVEAVGVVDLTQKFADDFPAVADQDKYLQPTCADLANTYAGGPDVITEKKLTVYWDNITEDSWKAGSRRVNCNLAALLPDKSGFAPVTGSVKGTVDVGSTPAPPAADTPAPGTPATDAATPPTDAPTADVPPATGDAPPASGQPTPDPAPSSAAAPATSGAPQPSTPPAGPPPGDGG